jgi:prepilin-type processing-associated H-X9-DG protein
MASSTSSACNWGCGGLPPANLADLAVHNGGSNLMFADGHAKFFTARNCITISGGGTIRYHNGGTPSLMEW